MSAHNNRWLILFLCIWGLFSVSVVADELSIKQKILMPGPLIAGHAKVEADCESCHAPFAKQSMTNLCLDCHKDIAKDRTNKTGFHGLAPDSQTNNCETCHTDHEGRDADITGLLKDTFDHQYTSFKLTGSHQQLQCESCHAENKPWREAQTSCFSCHKEDDRHKGALKEQCDNCHQPTSWRELLPFDHSTTDFPLDGKHSTTPCVSCHLNQQYTFSTSEQTCFGCHGTTDPHLGANGQDCESCHSTKNWTQITFSHDDTDFPLKGGHRDIPCTACHAPSSMSERKNQKTPKDCQSCHKNDDIHLGKFGGKCNECHTEKNWSTVIFDHQKDTDFPLTGKHENLNCNQCHAGDIHQNLNRDCAGCHKADDVHNNSEMQLCGTCHTTSTWKKVAQFDHDFSQFPLLGMHRIVSCQSCHIGNQFTLTNNDCNSCHKQDDKHKGAFGEDCSQCHTPNAWPIWQFDHGTQTEFALTGKHQGLACEACHSPGNSAQDTPQICGTCHRRQDIHNGEFGPNCDTCHSSNNFFELHIP